MPEDGVCWSKPKHFRIWRATSVAQSNCVASEKASFGASDSKYHSIGITYFKPIENFGLRDKIRNSSHYKFLTKKIILL